MRVSIVNGKAVITGVQKANAGIRAGAVDAVRRATADLAVDVAKHTPKKSGKARDSVIGRVLRNGSVGRVTYSYRKLGAWYMRIVLQGSKRHKIGLRLKTKRGLAQAQRYADKRAAREGRKVAPKVTRKRALAIPKKGGGMVFRSSANHPGTKSNPILNNRLAANQSKIFDMFRKSVAKRVSFFGR